MGRPDRRLPITDHISHSHPLLSNLSTERRAESSFWSVMGADLFDDELLVRFGQVGRAGEVQTAGGHVLGRGFRIR